MGKKPFSAKAKREQLRQKRLASTSAAAGPTPSSLSHTLPTSSNNTAVATNTVTATSASASPRRSRATRGGPAPSSSHAHRYRLVFAEDTDAARKRQRAQAHVPVSLASDVDTLLDRRTMSVAAVRPFPNSAFAMPRRPAWSYRDTVNVVDKRELATFREWLDRVQRPNDPLAAYFEGNLETWRQLWRVIERSDVLVLVADIRFPALHFVPDLYQYVTEECHKGMVLALNKCDLVPADVLRAWKQYFEKNYPGMAIAMFSSFPDAKLAPSKDNSELLSKRERRMARSKLSAWGADQLLAAVETLQLDSRKKAYLGEWRAKLNKGVGNDSEVEDNENVNVLGGNHCTSEERLVQKSKPPKPANQASSTTGNKADGMRDYEVGYAKPKAQRKKRRRAKHTHGKTEASSSAQNAMERKGSIVEDKNLAFSSEYNGDAEDDRRNTKVDDYSSDAESVPSEVKYEVEEDDVVHENMITIGVVGHPNAGKSSLINGVFRKKVVSTSRTPGHTKHLQTIFLSDSVRLCDCPGLVFPGLAPRELQILAGMYPISQVREPYAAVKYLADRVPLADILNLETEIERLEDHHEEPGYISSTGWTAWKICEAWAMKRGFRTAKAARLDVFRAANNILRLALDGRIVLATVPEDYEPSLDEHSEVSHVIAFDVSEKAATAKESSKVTAFSSTDGGESDDEQSEREEDDDEDEEKEDEEVRRTTAFLANAFSLLEESV